MENVLKMAAPKLIRVTTIPLSLDKLLGNQLLFMKKDFEVVGVSSNDGSLEHVSEKYGIRCHTVEMSRQITPFKDLVSLWNMYHFLRQEKPDIVHSHTPKAGIVGMAAAYFARVPVRLHTVAGLPLLEAKGAKRRILNFVEKLTCFFATGVYPNSFGLKQIMVENRLCKARKLKVLGQGSSGGIDLDYFNKKSLSFENLEALKASLGIVREDFVFVFVGRLVKDKGISELVCAFKEMERESPGKSKLLLVGDYEAGLDPLPLQTLQEISKNPRIISVGFQEDVRHFLGISDALVFPSYREGFPNVVLQAGAMEIPALVSNINGCNEIVENGINGIIFPPKSVAPLKKAMVTVAYDRELCQTLTKNSRSHIKRKFCSKIILKTLHAEYVDLLSGKTQ